MLDKISIAKMLTLWALVIMLTIQARALDLLSPSSKGTLPQLPLEVTKKASLNLPVGPLFRGAPKGSPSMKYPTRTPGGWCLPVARYFISENTVKKYLKAKLLLQIKKMLMCKEIDLAGMLVTAISSLPNFNLLSVLDVASSLNTPGGELLGGNPEKESGGQSPKLPLPLLSKATDALNIQETPGSLLLTGVEKNPVKGVINTLDLPNLPLPLNDVVNQAGKLTESTDGMLNSVVPAGIGDAITGLLRNVNIANLLLGLSVQEVTVENMTSAMTSDGILVSATTTAFVGGKGLAGPVVSLLGYQVHSDLTLKIGISTNNTQCVSLQVQDKDIKFKKVTLQVVETVTNTLPMPLPLNQVVSEVLTVAMKENLRQLESCDIDLSDFNECKNSTALFKYNVRSSRISAQGLSVFYCAKVSFNKNIIPVLGSPLPPDPKNANISVTLSHKLLNVLLTLSVKQSSTKMNNLTGHVTKIAYFFKSGNQLQVTLWIYFKKEGEDLATVETAFIISHDSMISKDKLTPNLKITSSENKVTPPEAESEVQDILLEVLKKFLSALNEVISAWNVPPGLTSNPLINAKVKVLKSNDLQAAN